MNKDPYVDDQTQCRVKPSSPSPALQWGKRILTLAGGLILAAYTAVDSYSATTRNASPDFALKVNGSDAIALVRLADYQLAIDKNANALPRVAGAAKKALQSQAINSRALRILGTVADKQGDAKQATRLIALAAKTSRRELGAQIWFIDRAAAAGDAKTALQHYDIVLRSNPTAPKLLFPAMGKALSNAEIRRNFIPYLSKNAPWLWDFLSYSVYNDVDPVAQANLYLAAGGYPRDPKFREIEKTLVERLYKTAHYAEAELVAQRVFPSSKNAAAQTALSKQNVAANVAPFQWRTGADISANSGIEAGDNGSFVIQAWAEPGKRVLSANKLLSLSAGDYVFAGNTALNSGKLGEGSYWQISCLNNKDQKLIWRRHLSNSTTANNNVKITNECKFQLLELYIEGGLSSDGARIRVTDISLSKSS
jgi:hypothetical protein